jgi:hypothetical protein
VPRDQQETGAMAPDSSRPGVAPAFLAAGRSRVCRGRQVAAAQLAAGVAGKAVKA